MDSTMATTLAQQHVGAAERGDRRREARLVKMASALARGAGGSHGGTLSSAIRDRGQGRPDQTRAVYRLLDREELTHEGRGDGVRETL